MWDIWDIYYDRLKGQQQIILDGLVVMISACHLCKIKRGRPGFDSLSGRFSFFLWLSRVGLLFFSERLLWWVLGYFKRAPFANIAAATHSNLAVGGQLPPSLPSLHRNTVFPEVSCLKASLAYYIRSGLCKLHSTATEPEDSVALVRMA